MIAITMTATLRPEILERTLKSFKEKFFKEYPCRLIINIDPIGEAISPASLIEIAHSYFPKMSYSIAKEPHLGRAFCWAWDMAMAFKDTKYLFHLEDDWELLQEVNLNKVLDIMDNNSKLAGLRFSRWKPEAAKIKNWGIFFPWNGSFFECPQERARQVGVCGHPTLFKMDFVKETHFLLDPLKNPEKQFHYNPEIVKVIDKYNFGVYGEPGGEILIKEIGEKWRIKQGISKKGSRAFFVEWEKLDRS